VCEGVLNSDYMCVFHIKLPAHEVRLSGDLSEIYIAEETFAAGDLVVVFSVLSQESIHGKTALMLLRWLYMLLIYESQCFRSVPTC
jgi:hypothetical protein